MATRSLSKEPAPPPLPTGSEIGILAVLWRQGASTVREVHEALGKESGYTTTLKLMQLMFEKGLVVRNERYRSHVYEARAPKEQTQRQIAGDLLKRAFEGSAKSLLLGALAAQPASGKDLAEIRSLLDEFEKGEKMITLLNQPWTERLGWTLLHFLWQGILVAALYALARALAGGRISARGRYAIACASLLAMTAAPALTYWWLGKSAQAARIPALTDWSVRALASGVAYSPVTDPWQQAMPGIVMAWFAGAAACSLRLLMGFLSAAALRRSSHAPVLTEWQQTLDRLIERMHVSRSVRLLATDRVDAPAVIGWLRPVILAPVGVLSGLAPDQVEALLAHELAHVRRHDYLVNVLQGIAESLLFYHPAVWWISNQIRAEREHCCDDLAVAASGDVLVYARALAELESRRPAHFKAALSASDGSLLRRIRRLADPVAAHRPAGWGVAWSLGALLLVGIAGVAVTGAQAQSQPVVKLDTVWTDTVKQGDLKLQVRGLGRLTSGHTAALKVAETQMQDVRQGEPVVMAFLKRKETVAGKVAVVHPEVANGTMTVDVTIDDALPPGINLEQQVDATITIGGLPNVVYVSRPVFGRSNSRFMLFKLEPDGHSAKKVPVQFGATSVQLIEVKSGLQPGDKVIVSDMSQYDGAEAIVLR